MIEFTDVWVTTSEDSHIKTIEYILSLGETAIPFHTVLLARRILPV
jgi:hypothetical protein